MPQDGLQDRSKTAQDRSKTAPDPPKGAPRPPRPSPDPSKCAPRGSKIAPRALKFAPRGPKACRNPPGHLQDPPTRALGLSYDLSSSLDGALKGNPSMATDAPRSSPKIPRRVTLACCAVIWVFVVLRRLGPFLLCCNMGVRGFNKSSNFQECSRHLRKEYPNGKKAR